MNLSQNISVVIDNGSITMKAGYSAQDSPKVQFPSIVGRPKGPNLIGGTDQKDAYVGNDAYPHRDLLNMSSPIQHGVIVNWENMTKLWYHCYYHELRVNPQDYSALLTEQPRNSKINREKTTQIMFESLGVPSLYLAAQPLLALYASGRTTGLVLDSGETVTHTVPIQEGYIHQHAIERIDIGGKDLTLYFSKILQSNGILIPNAGKEEIIKDMKQKLCDVSVNSEEETKKLAEFPQKQYKLPDGKVINLGNLIYKCTEALFEPSLIDKQIPAIHELAYQSVSKCNFEIRKELFFNIILCGGNTMFNSLHKRIDKQLTQIANSTKTKTISIPERKNLVFVGGAIVSSLSTFQNMWITRAEYQEVGPRVVHRKCI